AARYRLLETIRQYGREKLLEAGAGLAEAARRQHLDYYLMWTAQMGPMMFGPGLIAGLGALGGEQGNLRAAFDWAIGNQSAAALRLAAQWRMYWVHRDQRSGLELTRRALERSTGEPGVDPHKLTQALTSKAVLAFGLGDPLAAHADIGAAIALARQQRDPSDVVFALVMGATIAGLLGELENLRTWGDEGLALSRRLNLKYELGMFLGTRMLAAATAGEPVPPELPQAAIQAARASGS